MPLILRFAIIGTDETTKEVGKVGMKALALKHEDFVCEAQKTLRGKAHKSKSSEKYFFFQGKIEDLANRTKIGPDSEQCLYLPPREGKRGVWLQPVRTFADYMEGVRFAIICSMMEGLACLIDAL